MKKTVLKFMMVFSLLAASAVASETKGIDADTSLNLLKEGNIRFVNEKYSNIHVDKAYRKELAKGQAPFAVVVTCSDSRVSPEILFDQGLGDLFVIRTAGEVVDRVELGSIEYAVEHLGAKLIVVLGHDSCGAVKATVAGGDIPKNISYIADLIRPAVEKAKKEKGDLLTNSIENNVELVMETIIEESKLELEKNSEVKLVGAVYNFDTNKVVYLENKESGKETKVETKTETKSTTKTH